MPAGNQTCPNERVLSLLVRQVYDYRISVLGWLDLSEPVFQVSAFGVVGDEGKGMLVAFRRFRGIPHPAQQIGAGGRQEMVVRQIAAGCQSSTRDSPDCGPSAAIRFLGG